MDADKALLCNFVLMYVVAVITVDGHGVKTHTYTFVGGPPKESLSPRWYGGCNVVAKRASCRQQTEQGER